jgi:hypothetical protein
MDCLKSKLSWVTVSALLAAGCGGVTDSESTDVVSNDTTADEAQLGECDQLEQTQVAVVTEMWFARISDDGVSVGADLDQETGGCGVEDLDNPQGGSGVDNSFGTLIPILELTEGAAIEIYIQNLINNGEVLIMVEMEDVDDAQNDTCVNVNLLRGLGDPTVGTDKIIESGQTFDRNLELPMSRAEGQTILDGAMEASPLEFNLPFNIFDIELEFNLHDSTLRFEQGTDGHHTGYIAGGLYINEIIDFVDGRNDIDIGDLVIDLVTTRADLWPDQNGQCQGISVVFEFKAKPAFFYID